MSLTRLLREVRACQNCVADLGQYAQRHYLGATRQDSMTATVRAFSTYVPQYFPLPHPSGRSLIWMRKHPWFEQAVLAALRKAVRKAI
jgi:uracil-DNA glycosylase